MRITLLIFTLFYYLPVLAGDNDIAVNFSGDVYDSACQIAPDSDNQTVDLGRLYNSQLETPGEATDWVPVSIKLVNCPSGSQIVTARFSGTPEPGATQYYKSTGDAENVSVELQSSTGDELGNGATKTIIINGDSHSAAFDLKTRAISVQGAATVGSLESIIQIAFNYQ